MGVWIVMRYVFGAPTSVGAKTVRRSVISSEFENMVMFAAAIKTTRPTSDGQNNVAGGIVGSMDDGCMRLGTLLECM